MISFQFDIFHSDIRNVQPNPSLGSWGLPHMFKGIIRWNGGMLARTHVCYLCGGLREAGMWSQLSFPFSRHSFLTSSSNRNRHEMVTAYYLGLQEGFGEQETVPLCFQSGHLRHDWGVERGVLQLWAERGVRCPILQNSKIHMESGVIWFGVGCGYWLYLRHIVLCNICLCWH